MGKFDAQIARLREENRQDEAALKEYESGNGSISTLFSGLADDDTDEQARLLRRMIEHRNEMIAFYERLNARGP